jgi:hypothetical protein
VTYLRDNGAGRPSLEDGINTESCWLLPGILVSLAVLQLDAMSESLSLA